MELSNDDGLTADLPGKLAALMQAHGWAPAAKPIKGNQSGVYHTEDSPNYAQTIAEATFATEADALAAGYRKARTTRKKEK